MKYHLTVTGLVQGVGFRPFIEREAKDLGLTGTVCNSGGAVHIVVRTDSSVLQQFVENIRHKAPKGALIMDICAAAEAEGEGDLSPADSRGQSGFQIVESMQGDWGLPILPPDAAVCPDCIREMQDPRNRRFRYPFISCVSCGPRYSILDRIPYDRDTTSMGKFSMCPHCRREYLGMGRRRHAQTISCHDCGPNLYFLGGSVRLEKEEALQESIEILKKGGIVAVKGIGGYQYVCRPDRDQTVRRLRRIKGREEKPFAVMMPGQEDVERYCVLSEQERELLCSSAAPIVLLEKRPIADAFFSRETAKDSRFVGAFLPNSPLHVLLTKACGPLIVTSANVSGEPMVWREEGDWKKELGKADGILFHDREIRIPLDDSVAAVTLGKVQMIRRSRGYVPLPILDGGPKAPVIFAAGGDLKASFALAADQRIYPSAFFGDLESPRVLERYLQEKERMERLLSVEPKLYVCDMHPSYFSSAMARRLCRHGEDLPLMEVQHHHAHAASVMAEHHLTHCIGVTFDGTGYGLDGSIWGGEFLVCRRETFRRMGYVKSASLCGGDAASKRAWQSAVCWLASAGMAEREQQMLDALPWEEEKKRSIPLLLAAWRRNIQCVPSGSMGRLFDAVAAILGIGLENGYEGECAVKLEYAAYRAQKQGIAPWPLHISMVSAGETAVLDPGEMLLTCLDAGKAGKASVESLALGFHWAVAEAVEAVCRHIRKLTGEHIVVLSGGVFANGILLSQCQTRLCRAGFQVYWNHQIPGNDGGIAVGQAYLAKMKYGREVESCV